MSKGQRAGAVRRKQAKANTGPTPSRAATLAKKKKTRTTFTGGEIAELEKSSENNISNELRSISEFHPCCAMCCAFV